MLIPAPVATWGQNPPIWADFGHFGRVFYALGVLVGFNGHSLRKNPEKSVIFHLKSRASVQNGTKNKFDVETAKFTKKI